MIHQLSSIERSPQEKNSGQRYLLLNSHHSCWLSTEFLSLRSIFSATWTALSQVVALYGLSILSAIPAKPETFRAKKTSLWEQA
jgi:hypothetical protein